MGVAKMILDLSLLLISDTCISVFGAVSISILCPHSRFLTGTSCKAYPSLCPGSYQVQIRATSRINANVTTSTTRSFKIGFDGGTQVHVQLHTILCVLPVYVPCRHVLHL